MERTQFAGAFAVIHFRGAILIAVLVVAAPAFGHLADDSDDQGVMWVYRYKK
jgi:hypothetical protein